MAESWESKIAWAVSEIRRRSRALVAGCSAEALAGFHRAGDQAAGVAGNCVRVLSHQGYPFLFFELSGGADPKVLHYLEGERSFRVASPAFSDWLVTAVRDEFPDP